MGKIKKIVEVTVQEVNDLKSKLDNRKITVDIKDLAIAIKKYNPKALVPLDKLPLDRRESLKALSSENKRFHGAKLSLSWFPHAMVFSPCSNKFGYLTSSSVRQNSKLPFNPGNIALMNSLGSLMAGVGNDPGGEQFSPSLNDSIIPSGYTYFGQFVDHDITMDISSSIDSVNNANSINNMRTPALDLDNLYGRGPGLDPFLYEFPSTGNLTAIKFKLGNNTPVGNGGPSLSGDFGAGMQTQTDFDVPRIQGTNTAVIGDPRNDENLFVSQFHLAMLKFHNQVVDFLEFGVLFSGDIFVEAKKIVTHHYQWAIVNDFLVRICGQTAVSNALANVVAPINSPFRMPVEFSVAAYRFGHSLVRQNYWINHNFVNEPLFNAFNFVRNPNLPVFSNWVVDFNAFFDTQIFVPVNNLARKIDSRLANGLNNLPEFVGIMKMLAVRNLRRGLALGLPSGQATATSLGIAPMTTAQLLTDLTTTESTFLTSNNTLLSKTPLWYYILREAAVLSNGNSLGPLGAKIVADTFVRILKRDSESYLNVGGGFAPFLPPNNSGDFTVAEIVKFSGVNQP